MFLCNNNPLAALPGDVLKDTIHRILRNGNYGALAPVEEIAHLLSCLH